MKQFKRLASLCLTLLMLLGCLSGLTLGARAEETDPVSYDVWVLGTQVTEENKGDVLEDGTVRYDPAANTLYLDSLGTRTYNGESAIEATGDLILELSGRTILNQSDYGVRVTGSLRVRGSGSLTTTGKDTGVYASSLYLDDDENKTGLNANGYYYGIRAGELHLRQGTLTATSFGYANETSDPVPGAGIYAFLGVLEIGSPIDLRYSRSNVTLTASGAQGAPAIYAFQGIWLSDNVQVTAPASYTLSADGRTVNDGGNPAASVSVAPKEAKILLLSADWGGTLVSDQPAGKVYPGQPVSVWAVPDEGMYLNDISIDGETGPVSPVTCSNGTYTFTMPDEDVSVYANFSDWPFYDVLISEDITGGSVTTALLRQPEGETVELTVTPEEGYEFTSVQVQTAGGQTVELTGAGSDWSFKMPAEDVTVSATFRQKSYAIQVTSAQHGSVSASYNSAVPGASVNLYISENAGWHLETITVKDSTGNEIELIEFLEAWKFTMPASAVTVTATFAEGYPLIVGGVRVTSTNAADIFGDGKASFDYPSRTLTLNDLVGLAQTSGNDALIEADGIDLKITGTATLAQTGSAEADYAIFAPTSTITIQGSNTEIKTNTQKGGIVASNVSFEGGAVDIFVGQQDAIGVRVTGETGLSFGSGIRTVKLASSHGYPAEFSRLSMNGVFLYEPYQGGRNGKHFCDASFNAENVHTVIVMPTSGSYTVQTRINNGNNGTVTVEPSGSIAPGTSVTLTYTPGTSADSWIDSLRLTYDSGSVPFEALGNGQFRFIMPAWNVYANLNEIANDGEYDVTLATFGDGTLTSDVSSAKIYDTVTISAVPNRYSKLSGFLVTGASDGTVVSVTVVDESTYTFRMPKGGAKVEAYFDKIKYPLVFETYGYYGPTDEPFYWLNDDETHEITENYIIMPQSGYIKVYVRTPEGYTCSYDNLYRISGGSAEIAGGVNGGSRYNMRTFKMREVTDDHITISILCEREVDTPVSYPVWIGNTQVTNRNMGDIFKNGQWRYDPDTQTLYADNPGSISFNNTLAQSNTLIKASGIDLTVVCNGTLRSDQTGVNVGYGIWVENGSLTVNGDITVYSRSNALLADNIHIAGGNVRVVGIGGNYTNVNCRNGGTLSVSNGARLTSAPGQWQSYNGVWYDHNGKAVAAGSVVCGSELAITTPAGGYCNGVNVVNASGSVVNRVVIGNKPLSVTVDPASHAAISVSPQANNLTLGTEVSFTLTPEAGYTLGAVEVRTETDDRVPFTKEGETYRLTMPMENVTVYASCAPILYNVIVADTEHGTVIPSATTAIAGQTVSLEYLADPGYMPGVVMVTDADGNRIPVTEDAFVMPLSDVTVTVTFDQGEVLYPLWLGDTQVSNRNFDDVLGDGTASYDHKTHTLTLRGTCTWTAGHATANHPNTIYSELPELIIQGENSAKIDTHDSSTRPRGIYVPNGTVILKGEFEIITWFEAVWCKNITVADGTVKATNYLASTFRADNGELRFEKGIDSVEVIDYNNAALAYGSLYISDDLGVTTPEGGSHDGSRIYDSDGNVTNPKTVKLEHRSDFGVRIESAHGTVTATPARANPGDTVTLTVVADAGYSFNHFTVTDAAGNEIPVGTDGSFTMPDGEAYVVAHYDAIDYQVAGYVGDHGTVEPVQSIYHAGESVLLLVQPEIGYVLSELRAEDENGVTIPVTEEDDGWRFTMPASDVTLSAVFERGVYTITPVESAHGTPTADKQTAYYGDVVSLTAPDAVGYTVTGFAVIDSTGNQIPVTENQFTMPAADVTFSAIYTPNDYTVTVSETEHGSVTAWPQTAHYGDTVTLTVTPDTGCVVESITVLDEDGSEITLSENSFTMPAANVVVLVCFRLAPYTVTIAPAEHGSITSMPVAANVGDVITLTVTPDEGYELQSLSVIDADGSVLPVTENRFTMPQSDVTVTAVFAPIDYTVTVLAPVGGTVVADRTTAHLGDTVTLTATPYEGYSFNCWTVTCGEDQTVPVENDRFTMPAANVTVTASFNAINYDITIADTENGTVTADKSTATVGETVTLTFIPAEGYVPQSVTVIDANNHPIEVSGNQFTMPASAVTVTATFGTSVPYVDAQGNPMTPVSDVASLNASTTELTDGWWVVFGNITNNNRLTVSGSVNLILCDGATLNATKGIAVGGNNSLTIWAQSHSDCRGKLTARANYNNAAIGSNQLGVGIIVINGGEITATGGSYGAGIGGGLHSSAGSITINNGKVSATGGTNAAGIGGGSNPDWGGHYGSLDTIMITGGEVSAVGNGYGAGIGGGGTEIYAAGAGNVTAITITGGQITASSPNGYGIGPGVNSKNGKNNGLVGDVITFGWTEETDFIQSSRNVSADNLTFVQGKFFLIDGEEILATTSNIQNACKLIPILNPLFSVTVDGGIINGTVAADVQKAASGDTVTLTVTPDEGYALESLSVADAENRVVELAVEENGTYTFIMPASNVTVTATFTRIYTVTVLDTLHGTVTSDKATARPGQTVVITVTPDTCYRLDALTVTDADNNPVTVSANYTFTMPASDVTVSSVFKAIDYTITVNAPTHATVTVPETAHYGDTVPLTVTTDAGYPLTSVTVTDEDGNEIPVTDGSFTMPASNVTVTVQVAATDYTLTVPPAVNGSVSASKSVANAGDEITLTVEPAEGYVLDRIYVYDFVYHSIPLNEDNTFTMPAANVLVLAYFKLAPYTVTIAPTEHGTVTADKTAAKAGERVNLTVTPDADWQIASLTVTDAEGNEVDLVNGHFTMPASSVTVTAVFEEVMHTVTVSDTVNGTVTADPTSAHTGDTVTLTVTPDEGWELDTLTVTYGENQTVDVTNNQFTMPASDVTVTATFKLIDFTVTVAAYENGTVTADPTENLHLGDTVTLTVTPDAGYALDALLVKDAGNNEIAVEHDQFTMPASNVTVTATFKAIDYTVTVAETVNGTVTADQETAHAGDTVTLTVTPNEGYWLRSLTVTEEGGSEVNVTESTFTMPSANVIVTAVFANTYGVIVVAAPNGTVSVDKEEPSAGETVTLTVTPDEGYELISIIATESSGTQLDLTAGDCGTYTFPMPASDVTVTPVFDVLLVEYDLWLGDTQVTSRNAADILGNGTASYDHKSRTLNLNGFDGVSTVHRVGSSYHVIYTGSIDLTVTGSGTIKWTSGTVERAICAPNTSVTLNGDFTVQSYYECIQTKGLTVAGGSVVLSTTGYARAIVLTRGGNLRIENGTTLFEASSTNSGTDSIIVLYSGSAFMGDGLVFEDPTGGRLSNGGSVLNADGTTYQGGHVKIVPKPSYSITCEASSNGAVTADKASTYAGDTVALTIAPAEGYELDALTVTYGENQTVEVTNNQFTMPDADVTVTATFKLIEYTVTVAESANGSVAASAATAHVGEEITLTVKPDEGYELNTLTVTYGENGTVTVEDNKFTMPASNVTVTATFKTKAPVTYTYFVGQSLTLQGDIGVNFYVKLNDVDPADARVAFTWGSGSKAKEETVSISALTADASGLYKLTVRVAAAQMTDTITAKLYSGETEVAVKQYSVAQYARYILGASDETVLALVGGNATKAENLRALCKAMLIYGAKSQLQFKYQVYALADQGLSYTLDPVGELGTTLFPEDFETTTGLKYAGSSLVLESQTTYRLFFTVTDQAKFDSLTVKLGTDSLSYGTRGSYVYYDIANIPATNVLKDFTLTFGEITVTANAGEYMTKVFNGSDQTLQDAMTALYWYNMAAKSYFGVN